MTNTPISGFTAPGFEPVRAAFQANFDEGDLGAGFAVVRDGEVLVDMHGGFADVAKTQPWTATTLVPVYSVTKPVAALVIGLLADRGVFDFDAPVAAVWPEFAAHGKGAVTLAQALSHQAGVPGFVAPIDPVLWLDPPALSAAIAALEPMWPPGTANGYHAMTIGYILGELVRRATGRTLGTVLREDIAAPAGIDFHIGLPDSEHARCAQMKKPTAFAALPDTLEAKVAFLKPWSAPNRGGAEWRRAEIPAANGHGTALATARLFDAFANRGRIDGMAAVSERVWSALTQPRIEGQDRVLPFVMTWAAGVEIDRRCEYGPQPSAFAHSGMGGAAVWADPVTGVACAYVMNKQSNVLRADPRAQRLIAALAACL